MTERDIDLGVPLKIPPKIEEMLEDIVDNEDDVKNTAARLMENSIHTVSMDVADEDGVRGPYKDLLIQIQEIGGRQSTVEVRRRFARDVTDNYTNKFADEELEDIDEDDEEKDENEENRDGEDDEEEEEDTFSP